MSHPLYRIKDWGIHYETNRNRGLKTMSWISLPTQYWSNGYTELIGHPAGVAHFACWIGALQVAAHCEIRGTLAQKSGTPHTPDSLARLTRIPAESYASALPELTRIGWLEVIETCGEPAVHLPDTCGKGAPTLHYITLQNITQHQASGGSEEAPESGGKAPGLWGPNEVRAWWNAQAQLLEVPAVSRVTDGMLELWRARLREFGAGALEKLIDVLGKRPARFRASKLPGFHACFESEDSFRRVLDGEKYASPDLADATKAAEDAAKAAEEARRKSAQIAEARKAREKSSDGVSWAEANKLIPDLRKVKNVVGPATSEKSGMAVPSVASDDERGASAKLGANAANLGRGPITKMTDDALAERKRAAAEALKPNERKTS